MSSLRSQNLEISTALFPITALAYISEGSHELIAAGEGPFLKVYDYCSAKCFSVLRLFQSQAIHGIAVSHFIGKTFQRTGDIQVLIWGGWSVCIIQIPGKVELDNQNGFKISILLPETQADDWLLDACIASYRGEGGFSTELDNSAILVTAHNDLLGLRRGPGAGLHDGKAVSINYLVAGPRSILYSAHLYWLASNRVLVAAGTVYGEVLLWSVDFDRILHHCSSCVLHYSFTGHEGSVFGVRISEELSNNGNVAPRRILASCSDDRTIKIWDISSTTSTVTSTANSTSAPCLASAMGHASRIWGIRFLHQDGKDFFVVSFGEDASVQMWRLSFEATIRDVNEGAHTWNASLTHRSTFKYHSGKNIWSAAVLPMCDGSYMVCTGGADGCIVCFRLSREAEPRLSNCWLDNWTTTEVFTGIAYPYGGESDLDAITAAKNATGFSPHMTFLALEGSWKIVRNIKSAIIGQSSGIFEGTATFKKRPPTDVEYDAEYVYTEGGHFTSETGLSFAATRSYVYRFHGKNNSISVWFVKPIEGEIVDYLFHTLDFDSSFLKPENDKTPKASGYHKCGDDDYRVNYTFQTRGIEFNVWNIKYDVKGPKKDYVTNAQHTRNSLNPAMAVRDIPDNHKVEEKADSTEIANLDRDTFNAYSWISNSEFLVSTTQGRVLLGSVQASAKSTQSALTQQQQTKVIWKDLGDAADLKSYSIITSVKSLGIAYVVGPKGVIRSYNHPNGYLNPLFQLDGKAAYLRSHLFDHGWVDGCQGETRPLRIGIIASCIDCLIINLVIVSVSASSNTQSIASTSALDRPPRFLVTSSCFIDSQCTLALGSRDGRIAIYSLSTASMRSEKIAPCHVQQIHGWDAVTSVEELPCQEFEPEKSKTFILTTGRDGTYAIHLIERRYWNPHDLYFDFQTVHQCTLPFGPNIEGAHFDLKTQDILLWGFRNKDFTVWNETRKKEIMTVECGGAHRNWAFSLGEGGGGGILAWTQASRCNLYSQPNASHLVIQHGSHGREIKAVAVCPCPKPDGTSMQSLLATGAEDTRIRISACSAIEKSCINPGLVYLAILDRHTTGIQQLRWSSDGRFLFSAAGCEEFFVWRVRPVRFVGIGVRYEARCPSVTESSDLRIMDFTVDKEAAQEEDSNMDQYLLRMVYSDSSIRFYRYSSTKRFQLLCRGTYATCCLTHVVHFGSYPTAQVFTTSTDGYLTLWSAADCLQNQSVKVDHQGPFFPSRVLNVHHPAEPASEIGFRWQERHQTHQSSIKALGRISVSPSTTLLVTGGDDGTLALTRLDNLDDRSDCTFVFPDPVHGQTQLIPRAHASAITGIASIGPIASLNAIHNKAVTSNSSTTTLQRYMFATVGTDQKLRTWCVIHNSEKLAAHELTIRQMGEKDTCVADAACMQCFPGTDGSQWLVVGGVGIELWRVEQAR